MKATDGKTYKNIITGEILGDELWLGCNDSAENYIEVEKPIEHNHEITAQPSEVDLLKAQNKALSDRLEFTEDLIAEMAMKVYAE